MCPCSITHALRGCCCSEENKGAQNKCTELPSSLRVPLYVHVQQTNARQMAIVSIAPKIESLSRPVHPCSRDGIKIILSRCRRAAIAVHFISSAFCIQLFSTRLFSDIRLFLYYIICIPVLKQINVFLVSSLGQQMHASEF